MATEIEENAKEFVNRWRNKGSENSHTQAFWEDLLENVFDISKPYNFIQKEKKVKVDGHNRRIDVYIPKTKVLIEQKDKSVSLDHEGHLGTAFNQARTYNNALPHRENAKWIITCNFKEFNIYDMENPNDDPIKFSLEELPENIHCLDFLVNDEIKQIVKEEKVSIRAAQLISEIYNLILKEYDNPTFEELESLNILCVRLTFCMYIEDAKLLPEKLFRNFINSYKKRPYDFKNALLTLFEVLNTPKEERKRKYFPENLDPFPYVNGGLFRRNDLILPQFTTEIIKKILNACDINWEGISPAIFGAAYESTVNPETRRKYGMHYTSQINIHKVIDPLFLDDLKHEFEKIKKSKKQPKRKIRDFEKFKKKLGSLKFLDPACGSGNFLTETFLCLRRLENEALKEILGLQIRWGDENDYIDVKLSNFFGIEIQDFAVSVAECALWIAEIKMKKETQSILNLKPDVFPIVDRPNIHRANALRIDWNNIIPSTELNYIMGNPPFVGYQVRSKEQTEDLKMVFPKLPKNKRLDYVCAWYGKAVDYMKNTKIEAAYVSTNSIVQGQSIDILWRYLKEKGVIINFAYQTFVWANETKDSAHVHCVIIGFSLFKTKKDKIIYNNSNSNTVRNINSYLLDTQDIFLPSRSKPICPVPKLKRGSQATDDGNLILNKEEKDNLLDKYPFLDEVIRPFMNGKDFIDNKPRYCLWLTNASPKIIRKVPEISKRINNVKEFRLNSKKAATRKKANTPTLFDEIKDCKTEYLAIPLTSSRRRRYIPIGYLNEEVIAGNSLRVGENMNLFHFGVLSSRLHNLWIKTVAGRLKSDYSYSNTIVYNNFPWVDVTESQKEQIEKTAKNILNTRKKYPEDSLADLYDPDLMPIELKKAHKENDKAVMEAYSFDLDMDEEEIITELFKLYETIVNKKQRLSNI